MSTRNKVELRIAGKDYTIVGTEPEEYIQKVGHYIDKKMTEILRNTNSLSTSLAAVLTAINVADDFFKSREGEQDARKELKKALEELEGLKEERQRLLQENTALGEMNATLKLELAKREAELGEVRNSLDKAERARD
ncbi:MAG TPA: cell division protein ZapA [Clostridia bacterium]|nr:cell division protein ZapA [Clostridia bacterium]